LAWAGSGMVLMFEREEDQASCCGVNLAFAGFGFLDLFLQGAKAPFKGMSFSARCGGNRGFKPHFCYGAAEAMSLQSNAFFCKLFKAFSNSGRSSTSAREVVLFQNGTGPLLWRGPGVEWY
jgi:hypothetical protein